ncbi:hypothetical protein CMI47_07165 [Candidatus Pacearchaeota archaeon]|nr:hypothetical protein [Candidatus Pacearchaeota archaeon]
MTDSTEFLNSEKTITVVEVIQEGGWEYTKKLAWSVGRAVSQAWQKELNMRPRYEMRRKTFPSQHAPTHLKAVYPESWRTYIESIIKHHAGPKPDSPEFKNFNPHIQLNLFPENK